MVGRTQSTWKKNLCRHGEDMQTPHRKAPKETGFKPTCYQAPVVTTTPPCCLWCDRVWCNYSFYQPRENKCFMLIEISAQKQTKSFVLNQARLPDPLLNIVWDWQCFHFQLAQLPWSPIQLVSVLAFTSRDERLGGGGGRQRIVLPVTGIAGVDHWMEPKQKAHVYSSEQRR